MQPATRRRKRREKRPGILYSRKKRREERERVEEKTLQLDRQRPESKAWAHSVQIGRWVGILSMEHRDEETKSIPRIWQKASKPDSRKQGLVAALHVGKKGNLVMEGDWVVRLWLLWRLREPQHIQKVLLELEFWWGANRLNRNGQWLDLVVMQVLLLLIGHNSRCLWRFKDCWFSVRCHWRRCFCLGDIVEIVVVFQVVDARAW